MDIVYIGCGNRNLLLDGSVLDDKHFKLIEQEKDSKALLVEANPFAFKTLKNKCKDLPFFDRLKFVNMAVLPIDTFFPVRFFIPIDEKFSDFGSLNPNHTSAHIHSNELEVLNIESISLNNLLFSFTTKYIKHLILDLEGFDALALFSLDFEKFKIDNIIFEYIHSDGIAKNGVKLQSIIYMLQKYGYAIEQYDDYNLIAKNNLTK